MLLADIGVILTIYITGRYFHQWSPDAQYNCTSHVLIYHVGSYVCLLPFSQVCVLVRISRALACPVFAKAVKKDLLRIVRWGRKLRLFIPNFFHLLNSLRGELNTIVATLFTMFEKIFICTVKVLIIILHLTAPGLPHFKLKLHSALGPGLAFRTTSSLSQSFSLSLSNLPDTL